MTEPLWTAREALAATGGLLTDSKDWVAEGVSIDTRTLKPNDLFVVLKDQRDGHDFVPDAMARGAVAALVERGDCGPGPHLMVPDSLDGLRALARASRERSKAIRVAVTGSVGKTSVKEALAAVFRAAGKAHWSEKSYNNHWGVPLTLARMPRGTERAVFEMGMNHAGEIRELTTLVRPHVALITRIGPAHLENLGSMEAIADAKSEIFEGLLPDGVAIYPADDPFGPRLASHAKETAAGFLLDFGLTPGAAISVTGFESGPDGSRGQVSVLGKTVPFALRAVGDHWAWNAAAIFAAGIASGIDAEQVADALASVEPEAGRGRSAKITFPDGEFTLLDDSYNANPVSMRAGLSVLAATAPERGGKRVAVLGEMLELGPDAPKLHAELAGAVEAAGVNTVVLCGKLMKHLHDALPAGIETIYALDAESGVGALAEHLGDGDVVFIKGSNASGVHRIARALTEGRAFGGGKDR